MSIGDVLYVTAKCGGPAESLLRAMSDVVVSSQHFHISWGTEWQKCCCSGMTRDGVLMGRVPNINGNSSINVSSVKLPKTFEQVAVPLRFGLGMERGLVLRNCELIGNRRFSMIHLYGTQSRMIDYVIPVSRHILTGSVEMNLRQAAFTVLAFLLLHRERSVLIGKQVHCNLEEESRRDRSRESKRNAVESAKDFHGDRPRNYRYSRLAMSGEGTYTRVWELA